ncbi:hypothetical protein [Nocardioides gilvus]|uniref:hypothetical protein n=1 Tax=Nocardioides gilvus TaxID=1735589 RepID=UPI0019516F36|nr:hypothetical protein [Nocardioides gilvus]
MRFTEHELTQALHGAAKMVLAGRKDLRKQKIDVDEYWTTMDRYQRYQLLEGLGSQLIPVLIALPDVEVAAGTRPTFTAAQITEAVEGCVGDAGGKLRRRAAVTIQVALVAAALERLPVRSDPDGLLNSEGDEATKEDEEFVVPDSLEGLEGF